jgi:hypothetical protein
MRTGEMFYQCRHFHVYTRTLLGLNIVCIRTGNLFISDSDVMAAYTRTYIDTIPVNSITHATSYPLCPSVVSPRLANGESNM